MMRIPYAGFCDSVVVHLLCTVALRLGHLGIARMFEYVSIGHVPWMPERLATVDVDGMADQAALFIRKRWRIVVCGYVLRYSCN
jgi:hypothetical protein